MLSDLLQGFIQQAPANGANSHPLQQLRPMHLPGEPSIWPLAPGWWLLIVLLLVCLYFLIRGFKHWQKNRQASRYRQTTLELLQQLEQSNTDNARSIAELNQLLKRCAIQSYGRSQVSALSGQPWLDFLASQCQSFNNDAARLLVDGPYLPKEKLDNIDLQPLYLASSHWIKNHRRPYAGI